MAPARGRHEKRAAAARESAIMLKDLDSLSDSWNLTVSRVWITTRGNSAVYSARTWRMRSRQLAVWSRQAAEF